MDFEKSLKITVTEPGRRAIQVLVDSGSALIGSGGHCDIRLGQEAVAIEQLFFEIQPGGLFAEARANSPQVVMDGVPFQRGRVLEGRSFKVGMLEVRAELVEEAGRKRKSDERVRPGLLLVAAAVVVAGAYLIWAHRGAADDTDYMDAPLLFDSRVAACSDPTEAAASTDVESWLRDAAGRHERSPFSPHDGVEAVSLYRRAASCLKTLNRGSEADEVSVQADSLAERLEKDFHVHRVRLSRALTEGDSAAAKHEVSLLRGYLGPSGTDFASWLDYLDRRLGLQSKK